MVNSAYANLWKKIDENFMTAPKDGNGNPQPSVMKYLELVYSTEEAELLRHMRRPVQLITTREMVKTIAAENQESLHFRTDTN